MFLILFRTQNINPQNSKTYKTDIIEQSAMWRRIIITFNDAYCFNSYNVKQSEH